MKKTILVSLIMTMLFSACKKDELIVSSKTIKTEMNERTCCNNTITLSSSTLDSTYIIGNPADPTLRGVNKKLKFTNTSFNSVTRRLNVTLTFTASTTPFGTVDSVQRFRLQTLQGVTLASLSQPFWGSQKTFPYDIVIPARQSRTLIFNTEYSKVTGVANCYFSTNTSCSGISRYISYDWTLD